MQKPHYRLPKSMQHKTLDLRNQSQQHIPEKVQNIPTARAESEPIEEVGQQPSIGRTDTKPSRKKRKSLLWLTVFFCLTLLVVAAYILILVFLPKIQKSSSKAQASKEAAQTSDKNMLLIPTAGVSAPILEGDIRQLDKGLWHHLPDRGDPEQGGNFIITGHSFVWGYTPQQIKEKSIFYNLGDVKVGDRVSVYWNQKLYTYQVSELKNVKPSAVEIEKASKDPILTIYTCTLAGSADGRVVVIAKPL